MGGWITIASSELGTDYYDVEYVPGEDMYFITFFMDGEFETTVRLPLNWIFMDRQCPG